MLGFFVDVLEVESVDVRKSKDSKFEAVYARLRLAGGVLSVRVRDGVKILPGWSGKASGSCRIVTLKREFSGRFTDVPTLQPFELDTWVPLAEVKSPSISALDSFMGRK